METRLSILVYGKKAKLTKEGLVPIYLRVTISGKRFETSTHRYAVKYLINFKKVVFIGVKNVWISKDPFIGYKMSREAVNRNALAKKNCLQ